MSYATASDIIDLYGEDALLAADRDGDGLAETAAIDKALASASAEIDSYLAARYPLPLTSTHEVLIQYCVDIALYRLSNARGFVTDELRRRYEDALRWLKMVADGKAALIMPADDSTLDDGTVISSDGPSAIVSGGPERIFSRDKLRDY